MARKKQRKKSDQQMVLNITSMMDMFTIILVFLLKSYSTEAETKIDPSDKIQLPETVSTQTLTVEAPGIIVTKEEILVGNEIVATIKNWVVQEKDPNNPYILPTLKTELDKVVERQKFIAKNNADIDFEGIIIVQADRDMPSTLLTQVMFTVGQAEFSKIKLAAYGKD